MTDEAPTSKACTKCGVVKPLGDFSKEKIKKDGLQKYCKACNSTMAAKWRAENPEKVKAKNAKYRAENPEKMKAKAAKWRAENPEKVKAKAAKYHAENPEKVKAKNDKYRAENPEKMKAIAAKYRAENPEKVKAINTRNSVQLSNSYVAGILKIPASQAPPKILELKREAIAMKRISKKIKQLTNPKKASS